MSNNYFESDGRCVTSFAKSKVYTKSRKYFSVEEERIKKIPLIENYQNIKNFLCSDIDLSFEQFKDSIDKIKNDLSSNVDTKNILNSVGIPFILPKTKIDDVGTNIKDIYLPALEKSFKNAYPEYNFTNHCKDKLKNEIGIWEGARYQNLVERLKKENIVGLLFLNLNEFSFPASIETINNLPENFILAGGYEVISSLIGCPSTLRRDVGYPPLLWFSSLKNLNDDNLCYHIEPYGYNLTFNKMMLLNIGGIH